MKLPLSKTIKSPTKTPVKTPSKLMKKQNSGKLLNEGSKKSYGTVTEKSKKSNGSGPKKTNENASPTKKKNGNGLTKQSKEAAPPAQLPEAPQDGRQHQTLAVPKLSQKLDKIEELKEK